MRTSRHLPKMNNDENEKKRNDLEKEKHENNAKTAIPLSDNLEKNFFSISMYVYYITSINTYNKYIIITSIWVYKRKGKNEKKISKRKIIGFN